MSDRYLFTPRVEVTEELAATIRTWPAREAAEFYDSKVHEIEERERRTYAEYGLILLEVEARELYREIPNPVCSVCKVACEWMAGVCIYCGTPQEYFLTFDRWLIVAAPVSRTTGYAAKKAVESLLEADVPLERMMKIQRGNLEVIAKLSPPLRKDETMLADAEKLSNDELLAKIETNHPDQHIETRPKLILRPTKSARMILDEAIKVAAWLWQTEGREGALEVIAANFLAARCEREGFDGLSNMQAFEQSGGRKCT